MSWTFDEITFLGGEFVFQEVTNEGEEVITWPVAYFEAEQDERVEEGAGLAWEDLPLRVRVIALEEGCNP